MRYPHVDVMSVIEYALHMFDPMVNAVTKQINILY